MAAPGAGTWSSRSVQGPSREVPGQPLTTPPLLRPHYATTGQLLSVDPALAVTGDPYGYAGQDPVNNSDPSGLWCVLGHNPDGSCRGSHLVRRVSTDVWRPARAAVNLPVTFYTLQANIATGADCGWNSNLWTAVCYNSRLAQINDRPFTAGGVVMSPWSQSDTAANYSCYAGLNGWLDHETTHSDQWAIVTIHVSGMGMRSSGAVRI